MLCCLQLFMYLISHSAKQSLAQSSIVSTPVCASGNIFFRPLHDFKILRFILNEYQALCKITSN
jgi:hypothetical protein